MKEFLERAKRAHEEVEARYHDREARVLNNEQLMEFGRAIWPITYKETQDDGEALANLIERAEAMGMYHPDAPLWKAVMDIPHEQIRTMWAARWVDQGCHRIVIEDRFASLLMATDVSKEVASLAIPPWKAFLIEVPAGLLLSKNPRKDNGDSSLRRIYVHQIVNSKGEEVWNYVAEADDGLQLWRHGMSTSDILISSKEAVNDWNEADFLQPIEDQDERCLLLIGRLILSTCLALSDPTNVREQKRTKGRGGRRWRLDKTAPDIRTFILGRPITIDCRPVIRDYIVGKRRVKSGAVTVQFLVRGHWKSQPHGPNNSLRKSIHIEPYWKGPEDAKILARSTNLGSSGVSSS